jgi:Zn finger protein HypA/HybF involved in hydrogenase expression
VLFETNVLGHHQTLISSNLEINLNTQNRECWYYSLTTKAEKVECLLKCPHCGEEVPYENVKFCPNCGKSLVVKQKAKTDLVLVAAMLTIISATFSAGLGCVGFQSYLFLSNSELASLTPISLLVGLLSILGAVFGIIAGLFMLQRKNVNFAMLGVILLLVSAFGDFITLWYSGYIQYGFMEIALFCEITIIIFSILSAMFLTKTKAEFIG